MIKTIKAVVCDYCGKLICVAQIQEEEKSDFVVENEPKEDFCCKDCRKRYEAIRWTIN